MAELPLYFIFSCYIEGFKGYPQVNDSINIVSRRL